MLILRRSTPSIFSTLGCPSGTHALLLDRPPLRALPHSVEDRLMPIFSLTGRPCGRPVNNKIYFNTKLLV